MSRGKRFLIGMGVTLLLLGCFYLFTFKDAWAVMASQRSRVSEQGRINSDLKAVAEAGPELAVLNNELKQEAGVTGLPDAVASEAGPAGAMKAVLERIREAGGRVKGLYPQDGGHGFSVRFTAPPPAISPLLNRLEGLPNLRIAELDLKLAEAGRFDASLRFEAGQ